MSFVKRSTVGERLREVGEVDGIHGATATVDIRQGRTGGPIVTVSVSSNITLELNHRTTAYAYLDDEAAEELARQLTDAVARRLELTKT